MTLRAGQLRTGEKELLLAMLVAVVVLMAVVLVVSWRIAPELARALWRDVLVA